VATFEVSNIEDEVNTLREKELILRSMICQKSKLKMAEQDNAHSKRHGSKIAKEIFFVSPDSKID
jgi:hypothetical protein